MVENPSQAGYYGRKLSPSSARVLVAIGDAMIPAAHPLPGAGEMCVRFIDDFGSPTQINELEELLPTLQDGVLQERISELERDQPDAFGLLRWVVYHAYYGSPRVIDLLQDAGSDYHGAPQPDGYALPEPPSSPQHQRGSYVKTEEVHNAFQE